MPEYKDLGLAAEKITNIQRTSGTGEPGSLDTYTITTASGGSFQFQVRNGTDGNMVIKQEIFGGSGQTLSDLTSWIDEDSARAKRIVSMVYVDTSVNPCDIREVSYSLNLNTDMYKFFKTSVSSDNQEYIKIETLDANSYIYVYYYDSVDASLDTSLDINSVNAVTNRAITGSLAKPAGVYDTLAELTAAYPSGNTSVYVVRADGKWYTWNGSAWTAGGDYEGLIDVVPTSRTIAGISLESNIGADNLNDNLILLDESVAKFITADEYYSRLRDGFSPLANKGSIPNAYWVDNGVWNAGTFGTSAIFPVSKGDRIIVRTSCWGTGSAVPKTPIFYFADSSKSYISSYLPKYKFFRNSDDTEYYYLEITIPDDNDIEYLAIQLRSRLYEEVNHEEYMAYSTLIKVAKAVDPNEREKNESKLDIITIYQESREYVYLTVNSSGVPSDYNISPNNDCKLRKYAIDPSKRYFVTTGGKFAWKLVCFVTYTDENDEFLGYELPVLYANNTYPAIRADKYELSVPAAARYVRVICRNSDGSDYSDSIYPTLYVERSLKEVTDEVDYVKDKVDNLKVKITVDSVENIAGYANYYTNNSYSQLSVGGAKLRKYSLDSSKEYLVTSGWVSQSPGFPIVVYTDSGNNYLGYQYMPREGEPMVLDKAKLNPPDGSKYAWIHCRTSGDLDYSDPAYPLLEENVLLDERLNNLQAEVDDSKNEISILFVGNSLTQDGIAYLPYMLKTYFPEVKFKFYMWYNGGYTLAQQYQKFVNDQNCDIFSVAENVPSWSNTQTKMSAVLSAYKFDMVCLQEYFNYKEGYTDADLSDFNNCVSYIMSNYTGGNALKFIELFHAPKRDNATNIFNLTKQGNGLIMQKTICEDMLANGIAVYRALSTDLNNLGDQGGLSPDGTHTQEGLPCLLQTYTTLLWILDKLSIQKSIYGCSMRMTTAIYNTLNVPGPNLGSGVITGTDAQNLLAQEVAIKAFKEGKLIVEQNLTEYNS